MEKKTKIILSVLGLGAIIVPVVLLVTISSRTPDAPEVSSSLRNIDQTNVEDAAKRSAPAQSPVSLPSPSPSTESAVVESSPGGQPQVGQ